MAAIEPIFRPAALQFEPKFFTEWNRELLSAATIWSTGIKPGENSFRSFQSAAEFHSQAEARKAVRRLFHEKVVDVVNSYGSGAWEYLQALGTELRTRGMQPQGVRPDTPSGGVPLLNSTNLRIDPLFGEPLTWSLRSARVGGENLVARFPGDLKLEQASRCPGLWQRDNPSRRAEGEYQFVFELAYAVSGLDSQTFDRLKGSAIKGAFSGKPILLPFDEAFSNQRVIEFTVGQFEDGWKFRKMHEERGTVHPGYSKRMVELPPHEQVFMQRFSQLWIDTHRGLGADILGYMGGEIGKTLIDGAPGHPVSAVLKPQPFYVMPLKGSKVLELRPDILDYTAGAEHEVWRHVRHWSRTLPDPKLHSPVIRADGAHVPWAHMPSSMTNFSRLGVVGAMHWYGKIAVQSPAVFRQILESASVIGSRS